jgi:DNA-binding CsgD family transcriptional regulator
MLLSHAELGETGLVEAALAGLDDEERGSAYIRTALASLRLPSTTRRPQWVPARAALITHILGLLRDAHGDMDLPPVRSTVIALPELSLRESLSQAEIRVVRYLPTSLSVTEIADQLYLSVNTVRTHMRHLYDKLDAHRRHEAVERARALGLLAPAMHEELTTRNFDVN